LDLAVPVRLVLLEAPPDLLVLLHRVDLDRLVDRLDRLLPDRPSLLRSIRSKQQAMPAQVDAASA